MGWGDCGGAPAVRFARLDLCGNDTGEEGVGQLAAVLPQCTSLAHLDLSLSYIREERAGRIRAAAPPSLQIRQGLTRRRSFRPTSGP